MEDNNKALFAFSVGLADAVEKAAAYTVTVQNGDDYPGSGVAFSRDRVLTAAHALGNSDDDAGITVVDGSGGSHQAKVRGMNPTYDLALLEVEGGALSNHVSDRRTDQVRAGELVLAVARPSDDGIQSSLGVVNVASGTYSPWRGPGIEGVMRSDASRFPGFGGGPLIDVTGALVGVNVYGDRRRTTLTLPVPLIESLMQRLEAGETSSVGYLGVRTQSAELPQNSAAALGRDTGLLVVGLETEAPAEKAGVIVGDIIVALGERAVTDHNALLELLAETESGTSLSVTLIRGGAETKIKVEIGARPADIDRGEKGARHQRHPHMRRKR